MLHTWAVELGLGVLESFGIEPGSPGAWADIHNRLARSIQLPPDETTLNADERRPAGRRARPA